MPRLRMTAVYDVVTQAPAALYAAAAAREGGGSTAAGSGHISIARGPAFKFRTFLQDKKKIFMYVAIQNSCNILVP